MGNRHGIRNPEAYEHTCNENLKKFHCVRYMISNSNPSLNDYNYSCVVCGSTKECKALIPDPRPNMNVVSVLKFIDPNGIKDPMIIEMGQDRQIDATEAGYISCIEHIVHTGSDEMNHVSRGRKKRYRMNYNNRYAVRYVNENHSKIDCFIGYPHH